MTPRGDEQLARADRGSRCSICAGHTVAVGSKRSTTTTLTFELRQCTECGFAFVRDPISDFAALYDDAYYRGEGADRAVSYVHEVTHFQRSVRQYEWRGVVDVVESARRERGSEGAPRWLDFGCGAGGLVRYLARRGVDAYGFEEGHGRELALRQKLPILSADELEKSERFDVVTAIEVLEHVFDPLDVLRTIRRALKPGGLFFYTTGNPSGRSPSALLGWSYLVPEVHVSFYEPRTMSLALEKTGFRTFYPRSTGGYADIVRFKVLKNLGLRLQLPGGFPWGIRLLSPLIRNATGVLAHPWGIADQ
jgi:SAM-dependent methyltransferase